MFANFTNLSLFYKAFIVKADKAGSGRLLTLPYTLKTCHNALILLTFLSVLPSHANPVLDWSTSVPKESSEANRNKEARETRSTSSAPKEPAAIEPFPFTKEPGLDEPTPPGLTKTPTPLPPSSNSEPLNQNPEKSQTADNSNDKRPIPSSTGNTENSSPNGPLVEPFLDTWNSVGPINFQSGENAVTATQARRINNTQYEPIWRPIFSRITLDDFNALDCCARVMKSALWEAESKCEKIGHKIWQVGIIPFIPEKPPIQQFKSCYFLTKEAIGNAWNYSCTAKAQAKCYDPKLPQNYHFIAQLHSEQAVHDDLALEKEREIIVSPIHITIEQLLKRLPDMPPPSPPENLEMPVISLD